MLFSTVLMWLLIAAAYLVALPALWLLARGLWPVLVSRQREAAAGSLFISFLLGLIPLGVGFVVVLAVSKLPQMGLLAALIGGVIMTWAFVGAGGIAALAGERLWPSVEPWRQTMRGGLVLICCALLPLVGWLVLLPLIAIVGAGISLRALFRRRAAAVTDPVMPPPLAAPAPISADSVSA